MSAKSTSGKTLAGTSSLRFGLVGAGAIAQTYAQAFARSETASLAAVADVRREAAEALAQQVGGAAFSSHEQMADALELDAVVICAPPISHPEISIALLNRGIHVLCEKPLAIDSRSARTMLAAARRSGVTLTMASKFRYVEDVIRAKAIIASGILGDIVLFENTFASRVDMSHRWNADPAISGGGVLIDNGTHSVDIMRYLLGPLAELQVVEGRRVQDLPVEDTVRMFVRSQGGVMGSIDLSWSLNKEQPSYISIYGSYGTVLVGWKESKYRRSTDDNWIVFGRGYDKIEAFRRQIDNFARAIQGEESLLITHKDALASVEVIETGYEALWRNGWLPIGAPAAATAVDANGHSEPAADAALAAPVGAAG
jgi:predicted dehydrogenase